jgi:hypothetical protein
MKYLVCIFALWCNIAQAQIIEHRISDDGYARVPLQFAFPYYGRVFTESYMFSNGVVGFLNPTNSWCCTGFDLRNNNGTPFSFAIMPLQTDLINYSGRFLTEGTPQYQRYVWENISEYGAPQNLNTFGVEIRPSGYIGMHYEQVNISPWRPVTIGRTGDVGEFHQYYHGAGFTQGSFNHITESTGNICVTNPLSSTSCAGYQEAYLAQQCSISQLYSAQCPYYQEAYLEQQCSLNPLYSTSCQGYEQAYFNQQCSINALFNISCPNYEQAYFAEQCRLNPLYDRTCSGYAQAYALANIIAPSAPVVITSEPQVVADPVVNQAIAAPSSTSQTSPTSVISRQTASSQATSQLTSQTEKKEEKKEDKKEHPKTHPKAPIKAKAPEVGAVVVDRPIPQSPQIVDLLYLQIVKRPIQDNGKAFYFLTKNSQIKHEEMVDGQYRKRD